MPEVVLFAGPSAAGIDESLLAEANIHLRPPIKRGDVETLVAEHKALPGTLLICDGVFQIAPAVGHAELCAAIDAGWQVWGVSSLGAIRAHELRHEGMHGFGWVYEQFAKHDDFTDDELCVIHVPEPPWYPVTEALVNVRHAFEEQADALGIRAHQARSVIEDLQAMWFGDRTTKRIRELLLQHMHLAPASADAFLAHLRQRRVKMLDLERLLSQRPWRHQEAPKAPAETP